MGLPLVSQSHNCTPLPVPGTAGEAVSCDRHVRRAAGFVPAPSGLPHALASASLAALSVKVWGCGGVRVGCDSVRAWGVRMGMCEGIR